MSPTLSLDVVPLWLVFTTSFVGILLSAELGYRLGKMRFHHVGHEKEPTVGGIVAAELGLFAFLLAFTFGLAGTRFEARREALLDEANAIGTTYLRANMLHEPQRTEVRKLLREYVDVRLAPAEEGQLETGASRSIEIHDRLWNAATTVAEKDARSIPVGLFIDSLNNVIDLHAKRMFVATGSRIPLVVWLVLFAVAVLSFGSMGYQSGLSGVDRSPVTLALALAFGIVMWMVVDLERPQEGLLRVSQRPISELRGTMNEPKP